MFSLLSTGTASTSSSSSSSRPHTSGLRRRGSCESGFFSVGADDLLLDSGLSSTRSLGSSLLTVSDLEEDLRGAAAFLAHNRASSVFTDSNEDLAEDLADANLWPGTDDSRPDGFEKDIRNIVQYFEATCALAESSRPSRPAAAVANNSSVPLRLPRTHKVDSLIRFVVEKDSRDRLMARNRPALAQQLLLQRQQVGHCFCRLTINQLRVSFDGPCLFIAIKCLIRVTDDYNQPIYLADWLKYRILTRKPLTGINPSHF
jgi:hypothetical protein